jgi:hypothetical protein
MNATATRNATLQDMEAMLRDQHSRKLDLVVHASKLRAEEGLIRVTGADLLIEDDGVTDPNGLYLPTAVADEGIADKTGIPTRYLRKTREEGRLDLYDANVNGWLHGRKPLMRPVPSDIGVGGKVVREGVPGLNKTYLLRAFRRGDDGPGVARALLSDRYGIIDNLDALYAALEGVKRSGAEVTITGADLTERRMVVRVAAPGIRALAPVLLGGYRSPFTGASGTDNPVVFAGFVIANSETGNGAFTITPRITVEVCTNGMTVTKDAERAVHLGGRMEEGVIEWSEETKRKSLDLITAKTADVVSTFLSPYVERVVAGWEERAGQPVKKVEEVKVITKRLGFTAEQGEGIMAYFVQGGQMTMGGVANAATAYAQTVEDADEAYDLEARAMNALA